MPLTSANPGGPVATARARRVVVLTCGVVMMCLADLYMTLVYATSVGLHEANPVARVVMAYNCPWVVVAFRMLTIGLFALVVLRARRRPIAEAAAWVCALTMLWLTMRWEAYNESVNELSALMALAADHDIPGFVSIASAGD